jgi:hypothetical protein
MIHLGVVDYGYENVLNPALDDKSARVAVYRFANAGAPCELLCFSWDEDAAE